MFGVDQIGGDLQEALRFRSATGLQFQSPKDNLRGVEGFAHFQDGGAGELDIGADGETAVNLHALFAAEHEDALTGKGFVEGFGDAFANPIERLVVGLIEEREDGDGIGGAVERGHRRAQYEEGAQQEGLKPHYRYCNVRGFHSAKTCCNTLRVVVSVFADTSPSFFANRVWFTARTWSSKIKPLLPPCATAMRNGAGRLPVVMGATSTVRR